MPELPFAPMRPLPPPPVPHPVHPAPPAPALPMQGLVLLAVEDSRFASEALRLMAQRSGARLRRAGTLRDARRHLARYRPDAVLVDLGLPDGPGTALIAELARAGPDAPPVLGMSGDPGARAAALRAGAAGFLEKPVAGLAAFQAALRAILPGRGPPGADPPAAPPPDALALHEDLARAAQLIATRPDAAGRAYLAQFLSGVARSAGDGALERAAGQLAGGGGTGPLASLLAERLHHAPGAFARTAPDPQSMGRGQRRGPAPDPGIFEDRK